MICLDLTRAEVRHGGGRRRVNLGQGYEMVDMQELVCMTRYVYEDSEPPMARTTVQSVTLA
jgi:hypothetical protein